MSFKQLLFFLIFFFVVKKWISIDNNVNTSHSYLKILEKTIKIINEKKPTLLDPKEKAIISFILQLKKSLFYKDNQKLGNYLKKNLSKSWLSFFQYTVLDPTVKFINNKDTKNLKILCQEIKNNSFKKQMETITADSTIGPLNSKELWKYYNCILLKILIADFFKVQVDLSCDLTKDLFKDFDDIFLRPTLIVCLIATSSEENIKKNIIDGLNGKIDNFLKDYLVKNGIDWDAIHDKQISIKHQPNFIPMDNGAFLQTFKDAPFTSNNLSTIEINGPMRTLTTKHQKNKGKTIHKKIKFIIILLGVSIGFFFIYDLYKTTNRQPMKILLKSIEKLITTISFKIKKLQQKNTRNLTSN